MLTHFPPVDTYNAEITPAEVRYAEGNFKEHGWSNWSLMPFGHGNGGGGPTREMMERARRMADLDGVTPHRRSGTVDEFFGHVEAEVAAGAPVPVWAGELYFEMHRGTLTSRSRAPRSATAAASGCCARPSCGGSPPAAVPPEVAAEIDALWKDVLLQQFHDIIPGSSIAWVPPTPRPRTPALPSALEEIIADALGAWRRPVRASPTRRRTLGAR